jgi:adenine-specific DNA-methyltransferase
MFERTSTNIPEASITWGAKSAFDKEVEALHKRCGVYTRPEVVRRILDAVGWRSKANLFKSRLLEPAAGDGVFVAEAARRLVASYVRQRIPLTARMLVGRIRAFELHPREAERARSLLVDVLRTLNVHHRTAEACARSWVVTADFLLEDLPSEGFTHAVGNPPYIRWSKIPTDLKAEYERRLPREMIRGDLFLPFLDKALESLKEKGRCGFLCSDRWRFMAFAEAFRTKWLPCLEIESENAVSAADAFVDNVDSYPTVLIARKTAATTQNTPIKNGKSAKKTLAELDCVVRVGPALGHTPAFVLQTGERDVEPELLRPWIDGSEIKEGATAHDGRRVITMHGKDGDLLELERFPRLRARLTRFRKILKKRSIVRNGARWYRSIDRVRASDWARPKLLIPELAKVPRVAIDRSGAIPSHGVYAVFAPDDNVEKLYRKLRNGKLAKALEGIAPKVKGGYTRCYRRFLLMVRV